MTFPKLPLPGELGRSGSELDPVPATLRDLVASYLEAGRPPQPGIRWPRGRWVDAFPEHTEMLEGMPGLLDRDALKALCSDAAGSAEAAERAFVAVMAWGFGGAANGPSRTLQVLTATPLAGERLAVAAETLATDGPMAAYRRLAATQSSRLPWLGPAFGTKYLYFCQLPSASVRALILDDPVAAWLRRETSVRASPSVWSSSTYEDYMRLMAGWASDLGCTPEDIEQCISTSMASERGPQLSE